MGPLRIIEAEVGVQSLHDSEFDDFQDRRSISRLLAPLCPSKKRPLILAKRAVLLHAEVGDLLLTTRNGNLDDEDTVICGWKEKDVNGEENYCLGIMDERVTVAGAYYQ